MLQRADFDGILNSVRNSVDDISDINIKRYQIAIDDSI